MKRNQWMIILSVLLILAIVPLGLAQEEDGGDIEVFGLELEKVLNLGSGLLAAALFLVTLLAYKRTHNARLKYVSLAFLLFAIKGFLMGTELFFGDWSWVDPVASFLDFGILLSFFLGIVRG